MNIVLFFRGTEIMDENTSWDLVKFTKVGSRIGDPYVTVTNSKSISLSSGFLHNAKEQMDGCNYVIIHYSKNKNAIVLDFTENKDEDGAIKITMKDGKTSNCSISSTSFFNYFKIEVNKISGRHPAIIETIPGLGPKWVVYLKEKGGQNE
tara:strand:+ start:210 stop:659 length:450 start_codon:yes stop_codon:yes gene_type:complete